MQKKHNIESCLRDAVIAECRGSSSLRQLAVQAEMSASQLSRFIHGQRGLTLSTAARLASVLRLRLVGPSKTR